MSDGRPPSERLESYDELVDRLLPHLVERLVREASPSLTASEIEVAVAGMIERLDVELVSSALVVSILEAEEGEDG